MFINFRSILEPYAQKYNNCILKFVVFYVDVYSILEPQAQNCFIWSIIFINFGFNFGSLWAPSSSPRPKNTFFDTKWLNYAGQTTKSQFLTPKSKYIY